MKHTVIPFKTIGLLGGMSTEATRDYYHLINDGVNRLKGDHHVAELLIYNVNFQNITARQEESRTHVLRR